LSALATLRVVQGRSEEAIELYRTVVSDQPRDVVALNNLAALLSESAVTRADALKMIDRAIEIAGGAPELFDTKGTILVFDNKSGEAVDFLKAAIAAGNGDPRHRFHLALAYKDLDSLEQARGELQKALASDLDKQILTPTERKLLDEIRGIVAP
jgi:tetratricopeptide (TPR) repeat protein